MAPQRELTLTPDRTRTFDEFASRFPEASEAALTRAVQAVAAEDGRQLAEPLQVVFVLTGSYLSALWSDISGRGSLVDALERDLPWLPELVMAFARDGYIEELARWSRLTLASRRRPVEDAAEFTFLDSTIAVLDRFLERPAKAATCSNYRRPRQGRAPRRRRRTQRTRARSAGASSSDDPDPSDLAAQDGRSCG